MSKEEIIFGNESELEELLLDLFMTFFGLFAKKFKHRHEKHEILQKMMIQSRF